VRCIATGQSPRHPDDEAKRHAVVWNRGVEADPYPVQAGLLGEPTFFLTLEPRNG